MKNKRLAILVSCFVTSLCMLMTSCAYPHIKAGDGIATTASAVDAEKFTSSVSDSIENLSYIAVEAAMTTKSAKHKTNNSITKTTSSTTETTTTTTSTTTTTTETSATETTTETTTTEPVVTEPPVESETEPECIPEPVAETESSQNEYEYSWSSDGEYWYFEPSGWVLDNQSYYVLCNCVAHEAGSNWISTYNKALVCEVIFNRLNYWGYNSVYDVVAAPNQFTGSGGYVYLNTYSGEVNDNVISAVAYYCSYPEIFTEGYMYFTGDGYQNHFR